MYQILIEAFHCGHGKLVIEVCDQRGEWILETARARKMAQWKRVSKLVDDLFNKPLHKETLACLGRPGIKIQIMPEMPAQPKDRQGRKKDREPCAVCGGREKGNMYFYDKNWDLLVKVNTKGVTKTYGLEETPVGPA